MFMSIPIVLGAAGPEAPAPSTGQALFVQMVPLLLIFAIMYFLLIRPQQKRTREHQEMVNRLKAGDRVVTSGGIVGTVTGVKDNMVTLRIADKVEVEVLRTAVGTVMSQGKA